MKKTTKTTRQRDDYRRKNWTLELYDKNGQAYLVSPKHCVIKEEVK